MEEPEEDEPKNENYLSEIAFEDLTYADHEYNSYARPFHEDIPELEHFFGRDETENSFYGLNSQFILRGVFNYQTKSLRRR